VKEWRTAGRHPAVKYIALIQDGQEDIRRLESHLGIWVICTDQPAPFRIEGRDGDGNILARLSHDRDDWPERRRAEVPGD
jgi:hypothetical protein